VLLGEDRSDEAIQAARSEDADDVGPAADSLLSSSCGLLLQVGASARGKRGEAGVVSASHEELGVAGMALQLSR